MTLAIFSSVILSGQIYVQASATERHLVKVPATTRLREAQSYSVGIYLAQRTRPDDTIYNIGRQGDLYFHADRLPASRYFHEFPLKSDPRTISEVLADLEAKKPIYIIDTQWPTVLEGLTDMYPFEILPFLEERYDYEGRIYFDPALVEIYQNVLGDSYEDNRLTYYADLYRLKDAR